MLLTPRTYSLAQIADQGRTRPQPGYFVCIQSRKEQETEEQRARRMLLLHQTGGVKVGEVVRYTVTYTPSEDRILPAPAILHVRIRNTSAIPLRAAYLHGPYTIHVAAYPSTFNPNKRDDDSKVYGYPEFEPNVKAGGYWNTRLTVPEHIRSSAGSSGPGSGKSATWIIEIASQIIFSNSATVNYELLVARDERSLDLGFTATTGNTHGVPGKVSDHQQGSRRHIHPSQPKGVYSKAIQLVVDDTTSLWNKPELPKWTGDETERHDRRKSKDTNHSDAFRKQKKIHLVIVTHGLHSNLGADLLYLKESIDASAKQARVDRRARQKENPEGNRVSIKDISTAPLSGGQEDIPDDDDDDEEVIVRGFDGNVIRTERGIQYLGKRLAKYVLNLTYPDQPFLPVKKSMSRKLSKPFTGKQDEAIPAHNHSSVQSPIAREPKRAYKFTSISFIGHSLGGLVQTYAIAYIHKHSPQFFENIQPINFITMASPLLGLSNENPMYIRFALDFGLVGRTGQDLGLTWRAPALVRSGWTAMVSGFASGSQDQQAESDPGAKPLLRILPTGPAHLVLRMFRNRTLYSNVVNDGIVPLRTSCLLFLDWRGLDRVEKARRENGLIGTVAVWGLGQITGQNASPNPSRLALSDDEGDDVETPSYNGEESTVPLPDTNIINQDDESQQAAAEPAAHQFLDGQLKDPGRKQATEEEYFQPQNTLMQLWSYIRPRGKHTETDKKMFKRSQTIHFDDEEVEAAVEVGASSSSSTSKDNQNKKRPIATRGDSILDNPDSTLAPPKTTIFESAGDLINPPVPSSSWINDPSTRARTIFHDRVYHPEDIPPPPKKKASSRSFSSDGGSPSSSGTEEGGMRVEEKIARAYHRDLSWRKVLVRLEPDAHNNMIVRRMFANAYGWPVIKHLCDTHFADTYAAYTRDEKEPAVDRAADLKNPVQKDGEHVRGQEDLNPPIERTESELREVADELTPLKTSVVKFPKRVNTSDSMASIGPGDWDRIYSDETSEEEDELDGRNAIQRFLQLNAPKSPNRPSSSSDVPPKTPEGQGTSEEEITDFLKGVPVPMEWHRGLGASPTSKSSRDPAASSQPPTVKTAASPQILDADRQVKSPVETPTLSEVGLRRELDRSVSPEATRAKEGSGVSEQVASLMPAISGRAKDGGDSEREN